MYQWSPCKGRQHCLAGVKANNFGLASLKDILLSEVEGTMGMTSKGGYQWHVPLVVRVPGVMSPPHVRVPGAMSPAHMKGKQLR